MMARSSRLKCLMLLLAVLPLIHLKARQPEAASPARWRTRETERFILIYPESLSDKAAELSLVLDFVAEMNALGNGPDKRPPHSHKKWPLVLSDSVMEANGYVGLLPRRSVWFSIPAEDFSAAGEWWMLLARHEGRHMAQFEFADQGLTRFLHILFGELGWGTGIGLGMPGWLLEGDAVVQETRLSEEGRGRDALFTREVEAFVTEQGKTGYRYLTNPSFKRYIPSHYHVGYALALWIRQEYGEEALTAVYRHCARLSLPLLGITRGIKKATGKPPRELFEEMTEALRNYLAAAPSTRPESPSRPLLPPNPVYSRYDALCEDGRGGLYARKATLKQSSRLVHISPEGRETSLTALPGGGRVSITVLENGQLRIAWNSIRRKPVSPPCSVSDLTVITLNNKGRITRRVRPATGSRYLYPAISPDGNSLAAVYMNQGSGCRLDILDVSPQNEDNSGTAILYSLKLPEETAGHPSWSADGKRLVFTLRSTAGRRIAEWRPGDSQLREVLPLSRRTVKRPVYSADGNTVFFTAAVEGREEILAVDSPAGRIGGELARRPAALGHEENSPAGRINGEAEARPLPGASGNSTATLRGAPEESAGPPRIRRIARRRWGAEMPLPSQDGHTLFFVEYDSLQGRFVSAMELGGSAPLLLPATESGQAGGAVNEPAGTESTVSKPAVNEPAGAESTVSKPAVNEPAGAESTVSKPAGGQISTPANDTANTPGNTPAEAAVPPPTEESRLAAGAAAGRNAAAVPPPTEESGLTAGAAAGRDTVPTPPPAEENHPEKNQQKSPPPEKPWKPGRNIINVHSWGILPQNTDLNLFVRSDNILQTVHWETGALYEVTERAPGAYTRLACTGMRPNWTLSAEYRYRSPRSNPFHQTVLSLQSQLPMNLSRSSLWNHQLTLTAAAGLLWLIPAKGSAYIPLLPGTPPSGTSLPAAAPLSAASAMLHWHRVRPGPYGSFQPRLGWSAESGYSQLFPPGRPLQSPRIFDAWGKLRFYLPGVAPRNSLQFAAAAEYRSTSFSSRIPSPRGVRKIPPAGTSWLFSADYQFPLANPDWPIASLMFIQRFRLGLFSDFGFYLPAGQSGPAAIQPQWSSGAELIMDFSAFNNFHGMNIGIRFSWLWQENVYRFDLLLMDLAIY